MRALRWSIALAGLCGCQVVAGLETREVAVSDAGAARDASDGAPGCTETCGGASCVDLATDAKNCGYCGHSCAGGACTAGLCETRTLATKISCVGLALTPSEVLCAERFANGGGRVVAIPKAGGSGTTLAQTDEAVMGISRTPSGRVFIATGLTIGEVKSQTIVPLTYRTDFVQIASIFADDQDVVFTTIKGVWRQGLGEPKATELVPESTNTGGTAITADATTVYFARGRYVLSVPRSGGPTSVAVDLGSSGYTANAVLRVGKNLFVAGSGIGRSDVTAAKPGPLLPYSARTVASMAVADDQVFWLQEGSFVPGEKAQVRVSPVEVLGLDAQHVLVDGACTGCKAGAMVADATTVYYTSDQSIEAVPR